MTHTVSAGHPVDAVLDIMMLPLEKREIVWQLFEGKIPKIASF